MTDINNVKLKEYTRIIEDKLKELLQTPSGYAGDMCSSLTEAMMYSVSVGGKRIRPVLTLEFCRLCGGDVLDALSAACAIEMLHTSSLIHDDLPAIDNDDFRRGKPANHKKFNEAAAIFAGDALMAYPFEIIAEDEGLEALCRINIIRELARAAGSRGMLGGQIIDKENEKREVSKDNLMLVYSYKTGALISAACAMGCFAAGDADRAEAARRYGMSLGLAFQIIDDILDVTSTSDELGKPTGSDSEQNKQTYVSVYGLEKARVDAQIFTENALRELDVFKDSEFIKELTLTLLSRRK